MDIEELETRPAAPTLFQAIEEKGKYMGRTNILYSIVMVGKISPHVTNLQSVANYFESTLLHFKPPDQVTGLMMVYPHHVVNIIETSFRSFIAILRMLNDSEKVIDCYITQYTEQLNKDLEEDEEPKTFNGFDKDTIEAISSRPTLSPLTNNRILLVKDNIVQRIFRTYEVITFDMEPVSLTQYDSSETDERRLLELLNQLYRLSLFLADEPMKGQEDYVPEIFKMKLRGILRQLRETNPELVPPQVVVGYFAEVSKFQAIIPVQEYLNFYDIPYEVSLQSETTWPLPKKSFIYT